MAPGNTVDMFTVKAMLTHVGSHQITNRHSAFSPPGQDAEAINAAVIAKLLLIKAFLPATDLTSDICFTVRNTLRYRISASWRETHTPILASCYIS